MKLLICVSLLSTLTCCSAINRTKRVFFKYYEGREAYRVIIRVPKGFKLVRIYTGGEGEEYRYWYSDSSLVFISTAEGILSVNEQLIKDQEGSHNRRFLSDSVLFKGVDKNGHYWKEVKYKGMHYGYSNVSAERKQIFDNLISSVGKNFDKEKDEELFHARHELRVHSVMYQKQMVWEMSRK